MSANIVVGHVVESAAWDAGFSLIIAARVATVFLISLTWRAQRREMPQKGQV